MSLARNSILAATASGATTLGGFISSIIVARLLGVEGTGMCSFAVWILTVSTLIADLGIPGSLARYIPELAGRGQEDQASALKAFLLSRYLLAVGILAIGIFGLAAWLWLNGRPFVLLLEPENYTRDPLFWVLVACAALAQSLAAFVFGELKGNQEFDLQARLSLLAAGVQIVVTGVGAATFGVAGAIIGAFSGSLVPMLRLRTITRGRGVLAEGLRRRVQRFAWESWGSYVLTAFAWSRMEIFFLQQSRGTHAVGLFAVALTIANLGTQGPLLLTGGLLPYFSHQSAADPTKSHDTYAAGMRFLALLVFPSCLGAAAIAPALVKCFYGPAFIEAGIPAMVLLVAGALTATSSVSFIYLLAMERTRFVLYAGVIGAVLVVACGLTIVPAFGIMGAAGVRAAIQLAIAGATVYHVSRHLNCATPFDSLVRLMLAALSCATVAGVVSAVASGPSGILLAIAFGVVTYCLGLWLLRPLPTGDVVQLVNALSLVPAVLRPPAIAFVRRLLA